MTREREEHLPFTLFFPAMYEPHALGAGVISAKTSRLQANIVRRDPREEQTIKMERVKTQDLKRENKVARSIIERSAFMKTLLKVVGVLGVSLVMSGIFPKSL